jgi:hypothetical protein
LASDGSGDLPADAVEVTAEQHQQLLEAQSTGKEIVAGIDGFPVISEPFVSEEDKRHATNATARQYLDSTDWYIIRQQETGVAVPQEILDKRQAARLEVIHG